MSWTREEIFTVELVCGHENRFRPAPNPGDTVWCWKCSDFQNVITGLIEEKPTIPRAQCENCTWTRVNKPLKELQTMATTHSLRYRHTVNIEHPDFVT